MAVTADFYALAIVNAFKGLIDIPSDTIKVALTTSSYTPNQDTHEFFDDITNEVVATGYTAGGATLAAKSITYDSGTKTIKIDAGDTTWTSSSITARRAIVYKDTGTPSTSPLILYVDFGEDKESDANNFTIEWNTDGIAESVLP